MDDVQNVRSAKANKYKVILLGLAIHVLLLVAVFDVYFSSPLDHGMKLVQPIRKPPAKRLVLFVSDGLRAASILGHEELAPYLNNIMKNKGSWGVAHTRVPTESRPGHVAMLGGIYEDPSAILKGWKSNPVDFDSVINQSTNAWCWGSPDIIHIFNRNDLPKIRLYSYDSEKEDFGEIHTEKLDKWVFDKVFNFLKNDVEKCTISCEKYHESGNMFFLHLLGVDTAGHGFKPANLQYTYNIQFVDQYVNKSYQEFERLYNDKSTVYVFTADHGMSEWGSHGGGSPHETEVPFIAWGAGIKQNPVRQDIKQIDVAPFLSILIGNIIPINSLGMLPVEYLDVDNETLMDVLMTNTRQLAEIFQVKHHRTEQNALIYIPYEGATDITIRERFHRLEQLQRTKNVRRFKLESQEFMKFLIEGADYYHNYYQYPILISITIGFSFWICYLILLVLEFHSDIPSKILPRRKHKKNMILLVVYIVTVLTCYKSRFPLTYYFHFLFPIFMFSVIRQKLDLLRMFLATFSNNLGPNLLNLVFYLAGLKIIVYGFHNRLGFSILMLLISTWILSSKTLRENTNPAEKTFWVSCCLILSIFTMLPVMNTKFNIVAYTIGYVAWLLAFTQVYRNNKYFYNKGKVRVNKKSLLVQLTGLIASGVLVILLEKDIMPYYSPQKKWSWVIMTVPIAMVPFSTEFIPLRLASTFFGFVPYYMLVSKNYEPLFLLFYSAFLCVWLLVESKCFLKSKSYTIIYHHKFQEYGDVMKNLDANVFRRAFLFMAMIFLGFFGTGNVASVNSFDPMWVRAFLTLFSPFTMAALIVFKLSIPFIFTCCVFKAINAVGRENVLIIFCIVLIFSDVMVMQFLYLITNVGSWLEIGSSLSHFVMVEVFVMILLLLYGVAHFLTSIKYPW
ncbi:unnamed protein product [Acanthoscelides obtectus]|nr:unnamed protein product [Acanthoscelides obtectus]CAK1666000.1 GPI ethanolamine phosphate transferase 1 [Acanthoscelides obtectus]